MNHPGVTSVITATTMCAPPPRGPPVTRQARRAMAAPQGQVIDMHRWTMGRLGALPVAGLLAAGLG